MPRVVDLECNLPAREEYAEIGVVGASNSVKEKWLHENALTFLRRS